MSKMRGLGLVACLAGLLLAGCSRATPPSPGLATTAPGTCTVKAESAGSSDDNSGKGNGKGGKTKKDKKAGLEPALAYLTASNACKEQASSTTMGSVLAVFTRLRPGAYDADYKACMKSHGCDVSE